MKMSVFTGAVWMLALMLLLSGAGTDTARGQSPASMARGGDIRLLMELVEAKAEPFYLALQHGDWALASRYCLLTAESAPPRYYYESLPWGAADAEWRLLKVIRVDARLQEKAAGGPGTIAQPAESLLVISQFQKPAAGESFSAGSTSAPHAGVVQTRADLWLRTGDAWRVLPEPETWYHEEVVQLRLPDVERRARESGYLYDSLATLEMQQKIDRQEKAHWAASTHQTRQAMEEMRVKLQAITDSNLPEDVKKAEIRKTMQSSQEAMVGQWKKSVDAERAARDARSEAQMQSQRARMEDFMNKAKAGAPPVPPPPTGKPE